MFQFVLLNRDPKEIRITTKIEEKSYPHVLIDYVIFMVGSNLYIHIPHVYGAM